MLIEIDFNSDQAIYMQLRDQIIMGIASWWAAIALQNPCL